MTVHRLGKTFSSDLQALKIFSPNLVSATEWQTKFAMASLVHATSPRCLVQVDGKHVETLGFLVGLEQI